MKQLYSVRLSIQEVKSSFSPMPKPSNPKERETLSYEYSVGSQVWKNRLISLLRR